MHKRVVFAPDFFAASLFDPDAAQVINLWRDRKVQPAVNRQLLLRYLKILRALNLPAPLIRRWGWWFTAPDRTVWVDSEVASGSTSAEICLAVARSGCASCILCKVEFPATGQASEGVLWRSAQQFLKEFAVADRDPQ